MQNAGCNPLAWWLASEEHGASANVKLNHLTTAHHHLQTTKHLARQASTDAHNPKVFEKINILYYVTWDVSRAVRRG
jgi:hypothetical protein